MIILIVKPRSSLFQSSSQVLRIHDSSPSSSDDEECAPVSPNVEPPPPSSSSSRNKVQTNLCNQLRRKLSRHSAKVEPLILNDETNDRSSSCSPDVTGIAADAVSSVSLALKGTSSSSTSACKSPDDEGKKQLVFSGSAEEDDCKLVMATQEERPVPSMSSYSGSDDDRLTDDDTMKGNITGKLKVNSFHAAGVSRQQV